MSELERIVAGCAWTHQPVCAAQCRDARAKHRLPEVKIGIALAAVLAVVAAVAPPITAQNPQQPRFEVVSIKPTNAPKTIGSRGNFRPGGYFRATAATVAELIQRAYDAYEPGQIEGIPLWAQNDTFAIEAKPPAASARNAATVPASDSQLMLQAMLADRFKLTITHQTRTVPGYELVIAKGGFKLQPGPPPNLGPNGFAAGLSTFTIPMLIGRLHVRPDGSSGPYEDSLPVVDKTGLDGAYDIYKAFGPELGKVFSPYAEDNPTETVSDVLTRKMGLALIKAKIPQERYTVTHVERPTSN